MIIIMEKGYTDEQICKVADHIREMGCTPTVITGDHSVAVAITGNKGPIDGEEFMKFNGVKEAIPVSKPYKLASRECKPDDTVIDVNGAIFGGNNFSVIGGPCTVESLEQMRAVAAVIKAAGGVALRGGAYKPRYSPYSFQGLGKKGVEILREIKSEFDLPIVTEALDTEGLDGMIDVADIVQIGARNMQNVSLLKAVGRIDKPVMLKRGMAATLDEFLMAAEYILDAGNHNVILCERGIRSFDTHTRNLLDLAAVPVLKSLTHLPVIVDPSHGTGKRELVAPASRASVAIGAHAVIIEVHNNPKVALCDGPQSLEPHMFTSLLQSLRGLAEVLEVNFVDRNKSA